MKRVYVAGPYSANNVIDVLQNIGRGQKVAAELFENGFAPFTPWHDKDFCFINCYSKLTVKQFRIFSMAWLEVSDAVFLVKGWMESEGTLAEITRAGELNIPVFANFKDLLNWRESQQKNPPAST